MYADPLNSTFAALADPTRRAILARLASGETTVKELAGPFELTQPAITKHLKVLERAGLISRGREAQTRPARLQPAALQQASAWLDKYRQFWEESFDRLDVYLKELQQAAPEKRLDDRQSTQKTRSAKRKGRTHGHDRHAQ